MTGLPAKFDKSILPPLAAIERELQKRQKNRFYTVFPDTGPLRRELYVKHMEFLDASRLHDQTLMLAANKVGKTVTGAYAATCHATGLYPKWWTGKRFDGPTIGWACNVTATDCRDINQTELFGQAGQLGTGMIPAEYIIGKPKSKPSVPDGIEVAYIKHMTGGASVIFLKSYDQGRTKYQGRNIHWIWADEEVPADIYSEMVMRIVTTEGIIFCTYTPILGLTPITVSFLRDSVNKDKLPIKFSEKIV